MESQSSAVPCIHVDKDDLAWSTESELRCRAFLSFDSLSASGCSAQVVPCYLARVSISGGDWIEGELCQVRAGLLRVKVPVSTTKIRSGLSLERSKQASCVYDVEVRTGCPSGMVRYSLCNVSHEGLTAELTATTWPTSRTDRAGRKEFTLEAELMNMGQQAEFSEGLLRRCTRALMELASSPLRPELDLGRSYEVMPMSIAAAIELSSTGKVGPFTLKADGQAAIVWVDEVGLFFSRRPHSREWSMLPVRLAQGDDRGCLLECELMDDGTVVLLSVLHPAVSLGFELACSWATKRPWFATYHEAVSCAEASPIKSDGVIALMDGSPARPMKLKEQTADVYYSAQHSCMELEDGFTAPPSCQWPARPVHRMIMLDRQQGWAGVYSVALDSAYIERRSDRDTANSSQTAARVVSAARHSDYRAGTQIERPRPVRPSFGKGQAQAQTDRMLELCVASTAKRRLAEWVSELSPGSILLDLGCGTGRYIDLYRAAGLNIVLVDNDIGQLDIAWLRLTRSGAELECLQQFNGRDWQQKHEQFACWTSSMEPTSLAQLIRDARTSGREVSVVMTLSAGHIPELESVSRLMGIRMFVLFVSQQWLRENAMQAQVGTSTVGFRALEEGGSEYVSSTTGRHTEAPMRFCQMSGEPLLSDEELAPLARAHPNVVELCSKAFRFYTQKHRVQARSSCECCYCPDSALDVNLPRLEVSSPAAIRPESPAGSEHGSASADGSGSSSSLMSIDTSPSTESGGEPISEPGSEGDREPDWTLDFDMDASSSSSSSSSVPRPTLGQRFSMMNSQAPTHEV